MSADPINEFVHEDEPSIPWPIPASAHSAIANMSIVDPHGAYGPVPIFNDQALVGSAAAVVDSSAIPHANAILVTESQIRHEERLERQRQAATNQQQQQQQNQPHQQQPQQNQQQQQPQHQQQNLQQPGDTAENKHGSDSKQRWNRSVIIVAVIVLVVVVVATVAGICGTGNCGGGGSSPTQELSAHHQPTPPDLVSAPTTDFVPSQATTGTPDPTTARPTITPIAASRVSSIRSYINSITVTGRSLQYPNNSTAEERALLWLINDDRGTAENDTLALRQRYALRTLWFQTTTTTINIGSLDWATDSTECEWESVGCNNAGHVTSLVLSGIEGRIPDDVSLLTDLVRMHLGDNLLTGTIPSSLSSLTALTSLSLSKNLLTGPIPSTLGALTALNYLALRENMLNGTIPTTLGSLTALTYLTLGKNELSGTIPSSMASLTALTFWAVHDNFLTGVMPFCSSNQTFSLLVADCDKVTCSCCTQCCPTSRDGIPVFSSC